MVQRYLGECQQLQKYLAKADIVPRLRQYLRLLTKIFLWIIEEIVFWIESFVIALIICFVFYVIVIFLIWTIY